MLWIVLCSSRMCRRCSGVSLGQIPVTVSKGASFLRESSFSVASDDIAPLGVRIAAAILGGCAGDPGIVAVQPWGFSAPK